MMYYRYFNSENPMSDWGHAMFVDNEFASENYGDILYTYDGTDGVDIEDLHDIIINEWNRTVDKCMEPIGFEGIDAEDIYNEFNPEDIVMSAGAWDSELVTWFGDVILAKHDIKAVITNDGAIVFDPALIKRA